MTLAISHDIYTGTYQGFDEWRLHLAKLTGRRVQYFEKKPYVSPYTGRICLFTGELIIADPEDLNDPAADDATMGEWLRTPDNPLEVIFLHRDAEGYIYPPQAIPLADALEEIIPLINPADVTESADNILEMTRNFVNGLRRAAAAGEKIVFA